MDAVVTPLDTASPLASGRSSSIVLPSDRQQATAAAASSSSSSPSASLALAAAEQKAKEEAEIMADLLTRGEAQQGQQGQGQVEAQQTASAEGGSVVG